MEPAELEEIEMDLNTASPVEFDTKYAERQGAYERAKARAASSLNELHIYVGDDGVSERVGRRIVRSWKLSNGEALNRARSGAFTPAYNAAPGARALASYDEHRTAAREAAEELDAMDAAFRARGGWSRFWLVRGGHIHSSMQCSTCNKNGQATEFGWLPALSGRAEADAVAEHGALLCTVCFPSAPVEWTNGREVAAAERAASQCEGSRKPPARREGISPLRRYQPCSACGTLQSVTSTGLIRAHKPEGA